MMKLRKWSSLNKAERLGRKSAFIGTLVYSIPYIILLSIPVFLCTSYNNISFLQAIILLLTIKLPWSIIIGLMIPLLPIAYYFMIRSSCITKAYRKVTKDFSKTFVEEHLPRGEYCKVRIFKTRDYEDFITGLADTSEAYAVLGLKDELITLYIKINGTDTYRRLDVITKEEFSSFCELL